MEATGSYGKAFAKFLHDHHHIVHIVNPSCIHAFAKSKLSRHKTDKVDSMLIAEFAHKNDLSPYIPKAQSFQDLQDLYRCLQNLKKQSKQIQNYLEHKEHLCSAVTMSFNRILDTLDKEMATIESSINNLIEKTDEIKNMVENMRTIPGVGTLTAVAVLAETPDLKAFRTARELAAYAGLTPKHKVSGTSVKGRSAISKIGSSSLRKALYFPAIVAQKHNPLFVKLSQKLGSKGKPTKIIIVAIMRKLLHVIFGVIKHNKPFNPTAPLDA